MKQSTIYCPKSIRFILCILLKINFFYSVSAQNPNSLTNELNTYFTTLRQSEQADYHKEQTILATYTTEQLTDKLSPFYTDTLIAIRQKSYYLTYKKGTQSNTHKTTTVQYLLKGCNDPNGGIVGQTLSYLQEFAPEDFNEACRETINSKLQNTRMPHYKELVLLAGYINTGQDILYRLSLNPDLPKQHKWYLALALSRMGNAEKTTHCVNQVKSLPVNNDLVTYTLPDLVYTRQKTAIDYCVQLLHSDEKRCYSLNPDIPEKMICGYQIMTLLAPIIENIPVTLDASGDIITTDYAKTLQELRLWFTQNPTYKIHNIAF